MYVGYIFRMYLIDYPTVSTPACSMWGTSLTIEHGFTRFGVKNIKNNNKNNKAKPETKTNSTNHKGNKYSNKPFAHPNGKPTNKPRFQRSFPSQKPPQQSKGVYNHKGNIYNENNLSKPHFLRKTHHFHGGKSVFSKSIHPASFGKDKVKISLYQHNSMRKERLMQSKKDKVKALRMKMKDKRQKKGSVIRTYLDLQDLRDLDMFIQHLTQANNLLSEIDSKTKCTCPFTSIKRSKGKQSGTKIGPNKQTTMKTTKVYADDCHNSSTHLAATSRY